MGQDVLSSKQTASLLGKSDQWMRNRRKTKLGPPFTKVGGSIWYIKADVIKWLRQNQTKEKTK